MVQDKTKSIKTVDLDARRSNNNWWKMKEPRHLINLLVGEPKFLDKVNMHTEFHVVVWTGVKKKGKKSRAVTK